jgi:NAD(P)-dependent dehydrogenase (short-subunit alcohol dehydrogenase family)
MAMFKRAPQVDPFPGKIALVTGAGNGIGRATATRLGEAGASVIVTDVDGDAAARTASEIGGKAQVLDTRDRAAWTELAASINEEHGSLDILVNNAGVGLSANMLDSSDEDWDWVLGINLVGMINGCAAFGPAMVQARKGHIVNVSSGLGYIPRGDQIAYVTSKAGVLEFTRSLRADWCRHGLTVSVICPGLINSGIDKRVRFKGELGTEESRQKVYDVFAKGRPPERVADAILDAIRRNKAVVPVGLDASIPWRMRSFMPTALVDAIGRA